MSKYRLPFTDKSVRAAAFAGCGNETEYRFANIEGLVLCVLAGGKKTWKFHYSIQRNGKRQKRKVKLGSFDAMTIAQARDVADAMAKRVGREGDIVAIDRANRARSGQLRLTFCDLLDAYVLERKDLARIAEIERELRKDAIPALGHKRPGEVTAADIDLIGRRIMARGAAAMASRLVMHLKALYNFILLDRPSLAEQYGVTANPACTLGRRRRGSNERERGYAKPRPRNRFLTEAEIVRWWRALGKSEIRASTQLTLKLVLVTAQRPGEVRRARHVDLHLEGRTPHWVIPEEHSKNGRKHFVPLSPLAVTLFLQAIAISASERWLFPSAKDANEPIKNVVLPSAQALLFRNALTDIPPATVHDLRRSAATGMRRLGVLPHDVARILNHVPQDVTGKVYDHYEAYKEKRDALLRWGNYLGQLDHSLPSTSVGRSKLRGLREASRVP